MNPKQIAKALKVRNKMAKTKTPDNGLAVLAKMKLKGK